MNKFYSKDSHPISVKECNKIANEDLDYCISLLESREQEYDLFLMECKADIVEMKLLSENASEEELNSFREERLKEINEFGMDSIKDVFSKIKDAIARQFSKLKKLLGLELDVPTRGKDVEIDKSYKFAAFYSKKVLSPALLKKYISKVKGTFNIKYSDVMKAKGEDVEDYATYFFNKFSQTNTSIDTLREGKTDIANKVKVNISPYIIPAKIVGEYLDLFANDRGVQELYDMYNDITDGASKLYKKVDYECKMNNVKKEDKAAKYKVSGLFHGLQKLLYELDAYINDGYIIYLDMCRHRVKSKE